MSRVAFGFIGSRACLRDRGPSSAMADLFLPLYRLLGSGGDPRLAIDPASGLNQYGCQPFPCPDTLSFASSTATSISQRAYDRASRARESVDAVRDRRRDRRSVRRADRGHARRIEGSSRSVRNRCRRRVFAVRHRRATSGAVPRARAARFWIDDDRRGRRPDRKRNRGYRARATFQRRDGERLPGRKRASRSRGSAIASPASRSRCSMRTAMFRPQAGKRYGGSRRRRTVARAAGRNVLLQIMDSSKLGWRAPSDQCLDEIATRWPDRVQVVVDACQMRLGRPRLRNTSIAAIW